LVIEVDGDIHEIPEHQAYDIGRSEIFKDFGIKVIRFTNEQIFQDIENVIKDIEKTVIQLLAELQ
jgi:very-short-patch-repair endonuclease